MAIAGMVKKVFAQMQHMTAGNSYTAQLAPVPILDANGEDIGSFGDSLFRFNRNGRDMFTTEVATLAEVSDPGDYHVDYTTGVFTGIPVSSGYPGVWYQTKEVMQP